MSVADAALCACASALCAGGAASLAALCLDTKTVRTRIGAYERHLARELRYLQWRTPATAIARTQAASAAAALLLALALRSPLALACALALAWLPQAWLERARAARTARIEAQLDTFLVVLSNALRATPSLGEALLASAERTSPPLQQELLLVCSEARLGTPFERALQNAAQRIASPAVRAAFATLRIAHAAGGDLSRTLDAAAATLREMTRLHGVLRAKTAEGRAQSLLIAALPAPLIGLLQKLSPGLLAPLWSSARGHLVLGAALGLWLCAVLAARRITAVEL